MSDAEAKSPKLKYVLLAGVALFGMASSVYATSKSERKAATDKAEVSAIAVATETAPASAMPAVSKIVAKSSVTGKTTDITFPYHRDGSAPDEKIDVTFKVDYAKGQTGLFHITPDDCLDLIEVNGKTVALTGDALAQKCNWQQGFTLDLTQYLSKGTNNVHALVRNTGGWVGFDFVPVAK